MIIYDLTSLQKSRQLLHTALTKLKISSWLLKRALRFLKKKKKCVYSAFRRWEKIYIVSLITFAGWFSTLSSFIYYPVITFVARDIGTTVAKVNLTVTSYMIVSGIAPAIIGDLADQAGRRPTYVVALVLYFCANIGIALQDSFGALLSLRMLQSAGISGKFLGESNYLVLRLIVI